MEGIVCIEATAVLRIPETTHSVIVCAFNETGKPVYMILDTLAIIHPATDKLLHDCSSIAEQRPPFDRYRGSLPKAVKV